MAEVSNRTLATLLVAAIVISLFGTLLSLDRLGNLGGVSGLVFVNNSQSTGNVSLSVQSNAQLTLQVDFVDFGSWRVNGSSTTKNCTLVSAINGTTNIGNNFSDYDFTNGTQSGASFTLGGDCVPVSPNPAHSFELENTGNEIFTNITINSSKSGGSGSFLTGVSSDLLNFRSMEEGNACNDNVFAAIPGANGTQGTINSITANFTICKNLTYVDTDDAVVVQINITIPSDTPAQTAGTVLTFAGQTFG